jgi:hypothetical protein
MSPLLTISHDGKSIEKPPIDDIIVRFAITRRYHENHQSIDKKTCCRSAVISAYDGLGLALNPYCCPNKNLSCETRKSKFC